MKNRLIIYLLFASSFGIGWCDMNSVNETQSALTSNALSRILTCSAMVYSAATDRVIGMYQLEKANPYNDAAEMISIGCIATGFPDTVLC